MKFKLSVGKSVFFASVLVASAAALAGVSIPGTGNPGGMRLTDATSVVVNRGGGIGHAAVIPYFSTQDGNATLISIVNTDTVNGKAVKVRFRGAGNGDTLSDFTLLLAPSDVWTANVSAGSDGRSTLTTDDDSCTLPANLNAAFGTGRLPAAFSTAEKASWTREGYVEVINMADIPNSAGSLLYSAIVASGPASQRQCATTSTNSPPFAAFSYDFLSEAFAHDAGVDTPTSGLRVSSMLINIFGASVSWSPPATSLLWVNSAGVPARGRLVLSPQTAQAAPDGDRYTNDPLLRSIAGGGTGKIEPAQSDLPDLSTPYSGTGPNAGGLPLAQSEALSDALRASELRGEYLRATEISAITDWVVTQPMRRYAMAVDYSASPPAPVFNAAPAGPSNFYTPAGVAMDGNLSCSRYEMSAWDRRGQRELIAFVITGIFPPHVMLCGSAGVVLFDADAASILKATVSARKALNQFWDFPSKRNTDGWAALNARTQFWNLPALPLVGSVYSGATGPAVAGKSTKFGIAANLEVQR